MFKKLFHRNKSKPKKDKDKRHKPDGPSLPEHANITGREDSDMGNACGKKKTVEDHGNDQVERVHLPLPGIPTQQDNRSNGTRTPTLLQGDRYNVQTNSAYTARHNPANLDDGMDGLFRPLHMQPGKTTGHIVRALYNYQARVDDDLTFYKGETLEILGDNSENSDWLLARHLTTLREGYVPCNYVVQDDNCPESQEWWFVIDRRETDKLLLFPGNPRGTFLVRSSSDGRSYALSIRDFDDAKKNFTVKHYRVRSLDAGGCYISPKRRFTTLVELVDYYRGQNDGLCTRLTTPLVREPEPVPFKDIEVDRNLIEMKTKLGQGNFGEVWKGIWRTRVEVAIKTLKAGTMSVENFLDEAKLMHKLRHRKLVQLMGVCTLTQPIYIITELMVNGALLDVLRKDEGREISMGVLIDMIAQMADGMQYLEGKNFVHRDLRAANILVGENYNVKVADFGLARVTDMEDDSVYLANESTKFPIKWTAPEAAFERKFSIKSDVWSFGILIYEMVTFGRIPYPGMDNRTVLQQIEAGYRMPRPARGCPEELYSQMLTCWHHIPERRPTFEYLYTVFDDFLVSTEGGYREAVA